LESFNPDLFSEELLEGLEQSLCSNRFPHALLIAGPQGVGKSVLASGISLALLGEGEISLKRTAHPSYERILRGNHPDLKWISEGNEKTLKVQDIRNLIQWIRFQPLEGAKKVLVIEAVERLSEEALNAFLKILEEPPDSTVLILLSAAPSRLRATLISRCFQITLKALPSDVLEEKLIQKGIQEEEAHYVSLVSQGLSRRAESLLEDQAFREDDVILEKLLSRYGYELSAACFGRFAAKRTQESKREEVGRYLSVAETFLRDCLVRKVEATGSQQVSSRIFFKARLDWIDAKMREETIETLVKKLEQLADLRRGLERNANPKLSLMGISEIMGEPLLSAVHHE